MQVIYRMNPATELEQVKAGFEVQQATRTLDFDALQDQYKTAIYKKVPQVENLLELEAAVVKHWLTTKPNEYCEMVRIPKHFKELSLPMAFGGLTAPAHAIVYNEKQVAYNDELRPKVMLIKTTADPLNPTTKVPATIIEDILYLTSYGIDVDVLPVIYQAYHFHKTKELFYQENLLEILAQIIFKGIVATKVPCTNKLFSTVVPSWGQLKELDSYTKSQIVKHVPAVHIRFSSARNASDTNGLTLVDAEVKTTDKVNAAGFAEFLYNKIRPNGQGTGTVPFNISVEALINSYLYETQGKVLKKGTVIIDRKKAVEDLNAYQAYLYKAFLEGRANTADTRIEYFGAPKHNSGSDQAIKRGEKLMRGAELSKEIQVTGAIDMSEVEFILL